jgi:hypothetical protein
MLAVDAMFIRLSAKGINELLTLEGRPPKLRLRTSLREFERDASRDAEEIYGGGLWL